MPDSSEDDDVGYGRPPRRHQFKKGQSGNPRGRPRGSKSRSDIQKVLARKIAMRTDGKREQVSLVTALTAKMANDALAGDRHARRDFLRLAKEFEEQPSPPAKRALPEPKPSPEVRFVVVSATPIDALSQALIALGATVQNGKVAQLPSWLVEAAVNEFGLAKLDQFGRKQLAALMAEPEALPKIVRSAGLKGR